MGDFKSADIEKLMKFSDDSQDAIDEFSSIKNEFERINSTLLSVWKGQGAKAYKKETDHILENVGGISDVLKALNSEAVKAIIDSYSKLDDEMGEYNKNPPVSEE